MRQDSSTLWQAGNITVHHFLIKPQLSPASPHIIGIMHRYLTILPHFKSTSQRPMAVLHLLTKLRRTSSSTLHLFFVI